MLRLVLDVSPEVDLLLVLDVTPQVNLLQLLQQLWIRLAPSKRVLQSPWLFNFQTAALKPEIWRG